MSKKESVKSNIDTLRTLLVAVMTAIFGVLGYACVHIDDLKTKTLIFGALILVFLCAFLTWTVRQYFKQNKILEELE